jgi:hypothetical protein
MKLIYVNEIGLDYKGQKQYEFIFSKSNEFDLDGWYTIPASSETQSTSPNIEYIDLVVLLKDSDVEFDLIQNSDFFGLIDSVDGIVALAWEKFDPNSDSNRLFFRFGDSLEVVTKKIKERGLFLIKEEIKLKQI